jgi:hypothetical protein
MAPARTAQEPHRTRNGKGAGDGRLRAGKGGAARAPSPAPFAGGKRSPACGRRRSEYVSSRRPQASVGPGPVGEARRSRASKASFQGGHRDSSSRWTRAKLGSQVTLRDRGNADRTSPRVPSATERTAGALKKRATSLSPVLGRADERRSIDGGGGNRTRSSRTDRRSTPIAGHTCRPRKRTAGLIAGSSPAARARNLGRRAS